MNKREIMRGPEMSDNQEAGPSPKTERITESDLRVILPNIGETVFVLQRNAKDERNPESDNYGHLTPEAQEKTRNDAKVYFERILNILSKEEKGQLEILIVASGAELTAPEGPEYNSPHQRALETAAEIMEAARESLQKFNLSEKQIINSSLPAIRGKRAKSGVKDIAEFDEDLGPPKILTDSPEYLRFLIEKYGTGKELWVAYEADKDKNERERFGAEGVEDIAERMRVFVKFLARYGKILNSRQEDKRLIIWAVGHYDSLSPFIKNNILRRSVTEYYLPIETGAGITLEFDKEGRAKTEIGNQKFDVILEADKKEKNKDKN